MRKVVPLEKGKFYHIYNRGINSENLFREERNYFFFLEKWAQYINPIADTFAYCLLKNHFHFLIRIKSEDVQTVVDGKVKTLNPSQQFSNLFNSYAQSINKAYERTGGLLENPFKRKEITTESYFTRLVAYIHRNPEKHGFIKDFKTYPYSSYQTILSKKDTKIKRDEVLNWFGSNEEFKLFHQSFNEDSSILDFTIENA